MNIQSHPRKLIKWRTIVPVRCVAPGSFAGPVLDLGNANLNPSTIDGRWVIMIPSLSEDFFPIAARSLGVISRRGGACSHLAVILREMGLPVVVLLDDTFEPRDPSFYARFPEADGLMDKMICEF